MRIGLVTGEYPPDRGGVGDFTRELGQALAELEHEVHVVTARSRAAEREPRASEIVVHRIVRAWGWRCWRAILQSAREERLDALNVQFQTAAYGMHPAIHLAPARRSRPPVVVTFHDLKVPYLFPKAGPLRRWVVRLLAHRTEGVIVTNREDELQIVNENWRVKNLTRIPIGSNVAPQLPPGYDRDGWRAKWEVETSDLLLGYFGFLNERKGGEDLIETLAVLLERGLSTHLLLIGGRAGSSDPTNAAYAERVDRLIEERDLTGRVHRTGFVSPEEVSASLKAVDVCVLPYRDGASLRRGSLHACLAHGRPIVTTHPAVETPELRDGENVLLANPQEIQSLADCVARLAGDPLLRVRLGKMASAQAKEFTWDRIAARTAEFLAEAAA